jgi:hypothetical protein
VHDLKTRIGVMSVRSDTLSGILVIFRRDGRSICHSTLSLWTPQAFRRKRERIAYSSRTEANMVEHEKLAFKTGFEDTPLLARPGHGRPARPFGLFASASMAAFFQAARRSSVRGSDGQSFGGPPSSSSRRWR